MGISILRRTAGGNQDLEERAAFSPDGADQKICAFREGNVSYEARPTLFLHMAHFFQRAVQRLRAVAAVALGLDGEVQLVD